MGESLLQTHTDVSKDTELFANWVIFHDFLFSAADFYFKIN